MVKQCIFENCSFVSQNTIFYLIHYTTKLDCAFEHQLLQLIIKKDSLYHKRVNSKRQRRWSDSRKRRESLKNLCCVVLYGIMSIPIYYDI